MYTLLKIQKESKSIELLLSFVIWLEKNDKFIGTYHRYESGYGQKVSLRHDYEDRRDIISRFLEIDRELATDEKRQFDINVFFGREPLHDLNLLFKKEN